MTNDQLKAELAQLAAENQRLREVVKNCEMVLADLDASKRKGYIQLAKSNIRQALQTPPTPGLGAAMLRVVEAAQALHRLRFESGFWTKVMTTPLQEMDADLQQKNIIIGRAFRELDDSVQALNELEAP